MVKAKKVFDHEEKKKRPFHIHPAHPALPATIITNDISTTYTMSTPVPESITTMIDAVVTNTSGILPTPAILFPDPSMALDPAVTLARPMVEAKDDGLMGILIG